MKKIIKAAAPVLLSAAILCSDISFDGFNISAAAEGRLSAKIDYEKDGTALVTIAASVWENEIRYTTDGSVPTADSALYLDPIEVDSKTVIRAAEFEDDVKINGIKTTVMPKVAPITIAVEQDYDEGTAFITLDCDTLGAKIYYTTDGSKPSQDSTLYLGGFEIDEKTKVRARAYHEDYITKTTYNRTVDIEDAPKIEETEEEAELTSTTSSGSAKTNDTTKTDTEKDDKEKTDTDSDEDDEKKIVVEKDSEESSVSEKIDYKFTYMSDAQKTYVTLLKQKNSNIIRYTTDGSAVSKSSKTYSKRVGFTEPGVFRAKEYTKSGKLVATLKINVKLKCAPVEMVGTDISLGIKQIDFRCATDDVKIYYTTNGSTPTTENATLYDGNPVFISQELILTAVAMKDGYVKGNFTRASVAEVPYVVQDLDYDRPEITEVVDAVNALRTANGLKALEADKNTVMIANVRAKEISIYSSHNRPGGGTYRSAFTERDLIVVDSSEFFASTCKTTDQFISAVLKNSKEQIITPYSNYDSIGVGYYEGNGKKYWVLILAGSTN